MTPVSVHTPDGLKLSAQAWGSGDDAEILLIHGFNQSHLSWGKQVNDPALARSCRMATFDLRGHGASDKPPTPEFYSEDKRWADDVAAVIAASGLRRPVLVGWSYGGRVITDYVRHYGTGAIAGIHFVGAGVMSHPEFVGPRRAHILDMLSDDLVTNIAGTTGFVRACFERQPTPEEYETILAFNMVNSPAIRRMVIKRSYNPGDLLPKLDVPVLLTHGIKDAVLLYGISESAAGQVPGARLSLYDGVGHAPFHEDAARFNAELLEFARASKR